MLNASDPLRAAMPSDGSRPAPSRTKVGKIAELDGVRAISIAFVLLFHITYGRLSGGFLGVDVFFVLSGYLITKLLLKELGSPRRRPCGLARHRVAGLWRRRAEGERP